MPTSLNRQRDPHAARPARSPKVPAPARSDRQPLSHAAANPATLTPSAVLDLQRQYGNRAVQRLLDSHGRPAQRQPLGAAGGPLAPDLSQSIQRARGGGQALDGKIGQELGQRLGADFSQVRVHTGSQADQLSRSLSARAFTHGRDIFFRQGTYNPASGSGRKLLAHELTHVVQQGAGGAVQTKPLEVGPVNDRYEQEADRLAETLSGPAAAGSTQAVQRAKDDKAKDSTNSYLEATGQLPQSSRPFFTLKIGVKTGAKYRGDAKLSEFLAGLAGHAWIELELGPDFANLEELQAAPGGEAIMGAMGGETQSAMRSKQETSYGFVPAGDEQLSGIKAVDKVMDYVHGFTDIAGEVVEPDAMANVGRATKTYAVTKPEQAIGLFNYVWNNNSRRYNQVRYNCTDFAVQALGAAGFSVPGSVTTKSGASSPTKLYRRLYEAMRLGDESAQVTELNPRTTDKGRQFDVGHLRPEDEARLAAKVKKQQAKRGPAPEREPGKLAYRLRARNAPKPAQDAPMKPVFFNPGHTVRLGAHPGALSPQVLDDSLLSRVAILDEAYISRWRAIPLRPIGRGDELLFIAYDDFERAQQPYQAPQPQPEPESETTQSEGKEVNDQYVVEDNEPTVATGANTGFVHAPPLVFAIPPILEPGGETKYEALQSRSSTYAGEEVSSYEMIRGAVTTSLRKRGEITANIDPWWYPEFTPLIDKELESMGIDPATVEQVKTLYLHAPEDRAPYALHTRNGNLWRGAETAPFDTTAMSTNVKGQGFGIFVMSPNGQFFADSHKIGRFHHTSFLAGGSVAGAGEMKVNRGDLKYLTAKSGHYRPTPDHMAQVVAELGERGVNLRGVQIDLFYTRAEDKYDGDADKFLREYRSRKLQQQMSGGQALERARERELTRRDGNGAEPDEWDEASTTSPDTTALPLSATAQRAVSSGADVSDLVDQRLTTLARLRALTPSQRSRLARMMGISARELEQQIEDEEKEQEEEAPAKDHYN